MGRIYKHPMDLSDLLFFRLCEEFYTWSIILLFWSLIVLELGIFFSQCDHFLFKLQFLVHSLSSLLASKCQKLHCRKLFVSSCALRLVFGIFLRCSASSVMTSKSIALSECNCLNLCLLLVLLPDRFWLSSSLCWGQQSAPNVSHYSVWKPSYSSDSFLQVHTSVETWYFIFHSGLWMSLQVDAGSHATARPPPLISLTTTNCGRRTNERNIRRFHGNCHDGPSCPALLLAAKIAVEHFEN